MAEPAAASAAAPAGDDGSATASLRPPSLSLRWVPVWRRNFLVWQKLSIASLLGNFVDPLLYLLALGYGLGHFVGTIGGMPYASFLASGIVCSSAMNTATFEALYSAYTRMTTQQTWTGMLSTPLDVDDVVCGEMVWAGSKSLLGATAILVVATALGMAGGWTAVLVPPIALVAGTAFAALALVITAVSKSYDFFMYYFTLVVTPMMLTSGVFFPLEGLPVPIQLAAQMLPLAHAVALIRPLMAGAWPTAPLLHLLVLVGYGLGAYWLATVLLRRRLLS
jgi:lipooligosaccharide transport system permease protein